LLQIQHLLSTVAVMVAAVEVHAVAAEVASTVVAEVVAIAAVAEEDSLAEATPDPSEAVDSAAGRDQVLPRWATVRSADRAGLTARPAQIAASVRTVASARIAVSVRIMAPEPPATVLRMRVPQSTMVSGIPLGTAARDGVLGAFRTPAFPLAAAGIRVASVRLDRPTVHQPEARPASLDRREVPDSPPIAAALIS
jgi:hypothetical protein